MNDPKDGSASRRAYKPLSFIGEPIQAGFNQPPALEKKPGPPDYFIWRGQTYVVERILDEWHDYHRRGKMARNMTPAHATVAEGRGSWGVGRDFYRLQVQGGQVFEVYFDRAPKDADSRKGAWVLVGEYSL